MHSNGTGAVLSRVDTSGGYLSLGAICARAVVLHMNIDTRCPERDIGEETWEQRYLGVDDAL